MCWFMSVYASHAHEMKNSGRLKYMCLQNETPNNKERLRVCQLSSCAAYVSLTRPCFSPSQADTPCTISHGSDILL